MKQHITTQQLEELTEQQHQKLLKWAIQNNHDEWAKVDGIRSRVIPRLSIGQMIEVLEGHLTRLNHYGEDYEVRLWAIEGVSVHYDHNNLPRSFYAEELADALWQAVKEVL